MADFSSFANASGGHIIYGMEEEKGIAKSICGFEIENVDAFILKIENLIKDSLRPRVNNKGIKPIELENGKHTLIVRIPKSWNSPHMIDFRGKTKFYTRNSAGKHQMDIDELRMSFSLSESIIEKIKSFRKERLGIIESGETPIILQNKAKIVLHMVPFNSLNQINNYNLSFLTKQENIELLETMIADSIDYKYNVEGLVIHDPTNFSYTQLFRSGMIEAVAVPSWSFDNLIPSFEYEKRIINSIKRYLKIFDKLNVDFPIIIMLSLIGVEGFKMGISKELEWKLTIHRGYSIDRENLIVDEVIMNTKEEDIPKLVKPIFDTIWNACGYQHSFNYNEEDVWGKGVNCGNR